MCLKRRAEKQKKKKKSRQAPLNISAFQQAELKLNMANGIH